MARCFVLLIWLTGLQLTSAYIIDESDPAGERAQFRTEAKDETDTGDESNTKMHHELLKRMLKFIDEKGFEKECTEEAIKKTRYILKQRKEKDKSTLRGNYQILQHGEGSIASDRSWLGAIKSGICSGCVVTKICNHPPKYLSNNADGAHPDSKTLSLLAMIWGQFVEHDVTLVLGSGINCELNNTDPECVNVEIPDDDEVFRRRKVTFIEVERDAPHKPSTFCALQPESIPTA
ncbi:hypothetical protein OS493_017214 [Desmophyllum pertusum]|uniref:Uncharacterized protein n=1 Tax=Desmophyllum pertusum TaxID=174260 RepID=A0A9X0CEG1_9CNID|nr:hypothetical protein OS493_017214 [Desmophyllum pertusum]